MHKTCERTHAKMGAQVHYSTEQHHLLASQEPGITEIKHPGTADTAHRRAQASLQGRNRQKCIHKARACAQPNTAAPCTHPAKPHHQPGIMQKPGIPAQQMQARAGLQERNGPKPTRRARAHRPATSQRRVGRRRRGGGAPWFCERASGHVPATGAPMSLLFTGKKPRGSLGVALEPPNRDRQTHPPIEALPHACRTHRAKKSAPSLSRRHPTTPFVGAAPPPPMWATPHRLRRGRIDEMDTSRKPSTRPERRPSLQALR